MHCGRENFIGDLRKIKFSFLQKTRILFDIFIKNSFWFSAFYFIYFMYCYSLAQCAYQDITSTLLLLLLVAPFLVLAIYGRN